MARKFFTPIDLTGLELTNFKIHNLASDPTPKGEGHAYFNTVDHEIRVYNGSNWMPVGGSVLFGNTASRPAASNDGRLYVDTQKGVLYIDNGASWDQVGIGASTTDTLTNKTISGAKVTGTTSFRDGSDVEYASISDGVEGELQITGDNALTIQGGGDVNITTTIGDLILNADGSNYLYSSSTTDNLIATQGWVLSNSSNYIDSVETANFTVTSGELSLNSSITVDDIHFQSSETDYLTIDRSGTGTARLIAPDDISIRSQNGDIILYPGSNNQWGGDGGTGKAYVNWGNDATGAGPENEIATVGVAQVFTNKTINDELFFTNPSTIPNDGGIYVNDSTEAFTLKAYTNNLELYAIAGNINLDADGQVNINNSALYVNNGQNAYLSHAAYIGGSAFANDGALIIQDYNGENLVFFNTDGNANGGTATFGIKGEIDVYRPGSAGNKVGEIYGDADNNLVINANYNDLVLHSDSGNAYMNSVSADNRIIKYSEIAALQSGLDWKQAVNLLWDNATTDTGVSGTLVIDGHAALTSAQNGYRILATGAGTDTGIYVYNDDDTTWTLTRPADANTDAELKGAAVFVMEGDVYGATSWVQTNHYVTDFADQVWIQFSGQGTYTAGDGVAITGQSISVKLDETNTSKSGLKEDGNGLSVKLKTNGLLKSTADGLEVELGAGLTKDGNTAVIDTDIVVRKYSEDLTYETGTPTTFTITHNLGTRDVVVAVYDTTTYEEVIVDVTRTSTSVVTIGFAVSPDSGAFRVVVHA